MENGDQCSHRQNGNDSSKRRTITGNLFLKLIKRALSLTKTITLIGVLMMIMPLKTSTGSCYMPMDTDYPTQVIQKKKQKEEQQKIMCQVEEWLKLPQLKSPDRRHKIKAKTVRTEVLEQLAKVQQELSFNLKFNNGHRTKKYNYFLKRRGYKAARNSAHIGGWAIDIATKHLTIDQKKELIASVCKHFSRIGIGKSLVHVDMDPNKPDAIWTYAY